MRTHFLKLAMTIGMCLCALWPAIADDGMKASKESVEAKYLSFFAVYVEWPGDKAVTQTHVANVCIIGDNPFNASALDIFKKASSAQITYNVMTAITDSQIPACQILFISPSEDGRIGSIIGHARGHGVLTVSDAEDFIEKGGMVEFKKVEKTIGLFSADKINLRINVKAAEAEHLRINAQLLEIAAEIIK